MNSEASSTQEKPWLTEPDRLEWRHEGFVCLIVRSPATGALCGYVGVAETHPLYGKSYDDIDSIDVHGGLTFAAPCTEDGHICHSPLPGESNTVWWLGFDCAHAGDVMPKMAEALAGVAVRAYADLERLDLGPKLVSRDSYKDIAYVTAEVNSLAEQLSGYGTHEQRQATA